ncbi:MAG: Minf_1886 family protein [Planctomycetota bacterium]
MGYICGMVSAELLEAVRLTRYPLEAFLFVQQGLDQTVRDMHGEPDDDDILEDPAESERHVTGRELCTGLRDFAVEQFGLMALTVLRYWGIHRSEDFGNIVFAMVDAGVMHKTDGDTIEDFQNVFEFKDAFGPETLVLS